MVKKKRKFMISVNVDDKTENTLMKVAGGNVSLGVRVCAAFWKKHHENSEAQPVDDELKKNSHSQNDDESEKPGFLDD